MLILNQYYPLIQSTIQMVPYLMLMLVLDYYYQYNVQQPYVLQLMLVQLMLVDNVMP